MRAGWNNVVLACLLAAWMVPAGAALPEPEAGLWQLEPEVRMNGQNVSQMVGALRAPRQVCVSAEDARMMADPERALALWGGSLAEKGCVVDRLSVAGSTLNFAGACRGEGSVFQGDVDGELVYHSRRHVSGKLLGKGMPALGGWAEALRGAAQAAGQTLRTELKVQMQWQGAACGDAPAIGGKR